MATQHALNFMGAPMKDRNEIRKFVLAGNSTFTVVSKATGQRYTYKVKSTAKDRDQNWSTENQNRNFYFVSVLYGSDNESSYKYMGELIRQNPSGHAFNYRVGRKSTFNEHSIWQKPFIWFWKQIESNSESLDQLEFWHEGRCGRCGRKLTVPASIESGYGPECAGKE